LDSINTVGLATNGGFDRPHPDLLPSVFAALRRDRAEAKGGGGQEKEQQTAAFGFANERLQTPIFDFRMDGR
jgi:hypothetical protein